MPGSDATLHIGDVAERVDLSLRSVRYYEEQGLVKPEGRTAGGFRLYGEAQIARLLLIKQMKPLGFSLEEMREVLQDKDVVADHAAPEAQRREAQARLADAATRAESRCSKLERAVSAGRAFVADLRESTPPPA